MSMRTLFWCSCQAVVTVAIVVYLAANYADKHPDSLAARCVNFATAVVTDYNPAYQLGRLLGRQADRVVHGGSSRSTDCSSEQCAPPDVARSAPPTPPAQVIDLTVQECMEPPCGDVCTPPTCAAQCKTVQVEGQPVTVGPGAIEESEDGLAHMPLCDEGNDPQPATPPPTSDDGLCRMLLQLFQEDEYKEAETIPPPHEGASCEEGTPGHCPKEAELVPPPHEVKPAADEHDGSSEEASSLPGNPPDCREDPTYPERYPTCPPMDRKAEHPQAPEGAPQAEVEVKVQETATGSLMFGVGVNSDAGVTSNIVLNERNFEVVKDSEESKVTPRSLEVPPAPDVDTMEFRTSDARPGEFEPKAH